MSDAPTQVYATDKDIYDLLMSGRQKMTTDFLIEMARSRRIFYSEKTNKDYLVDRLSIIPFDFFEVTDLVEKRGATRKIEKTTSVSLAVQLSKEEMHQVMDEYRKELGDTEILRFQPRKLDSLFVNVEYNEYDFSRTKLIQKQRKSADVEMKSENGETIIRIPATDKGRKIVEVIQHKCEQLRKEKVTKQEISLEMFDAAEDKTLFFLKLISKMDGFNLYTVTNLKVASLLKDGNLESEFEEEDQAKSEVFALVHSIALRGQNLVESQQYQDLRRSGFFITSITWRAIQQAKPYDMMEFAVAFEQEQESTGFKYSVRFSKLVRSGEYSKSFKAVEDSRKSLLYNLIENSARDIVKNMALSKSDH